MMVRFFYYTSLFLVIMSCGSIKLDTETYQKIIEKNTIQLGSIGEKKVKYVVDKKIVSSAIPNYTIPIPVRIFKIDTASKNYKKLVKLISSSKKTDTTKATKIFNFAKIEIIDNVKIIENIENPNNKNYREYIENQPKANIITSIVAQLNEETFQNLTNNGSFILKSTPKGVLTIENTSAKHKFETQEFRVLGYQSDYFCWGANYKRKIVLRNLADHKCSCAKGTAIKTSKIKKDLEYATF